MENASKALIMAGAMIIGLLLAALMVWFFSSARGLRGRYTEHINEIRVNEFNAKFNVYAITQEQYEASGGKEYVSIYDIVSLARFADKYNEGLEPTNNNYIHIRINEKLYYLNKEKSGPTYSKFANQDICNLTRPGTVEKIEYNELIEWNSMKGSIIDKEFVVSKEAETRKFVLSKINYNDATGKINEMIFVDAK